MGGGSGVRGGTEEGVGGLGRGWLPQSPSRRLKVEVGWLSGWDGGPVAEHPSMVRCAVPSPSQPRLVPVVTLCVTIFGLARGEGCGGTGGCAPLSCRHRA